MSHQAARDFFSKARVEETIREEILAAFEHREETYNIIVQLGAKYGYNFTAEEVEKNIQNAGILYPKTLPDPR